MSFVRSSQANGYEGPVVCNNSNYLLNKVDTSLKIHTEIDELPDNTFLLVLFLLQHKHVVVEELLQTFIGKVDADLLKSVILQQRQDQCVTAGNKSSK